MSGNKDFQLFGGITAQVGKVTEFRDAEYHSIVHRWDTTSDFSLSDNRDHSLFGFVYHGETQLTAGNSSYRLRRGQFFCVPTPCSLVGGEGMIVQHPDLRAMSLLGGPIEDSGRLRYISGCTDTLLLAPMRKGDPCLNALYFPERTDQQPHTHPSVRIGMVASGTGEAVLENRIEPLRTGDIFMILPEVLHSFRTASESMVVIAYHPDSDFGPVDEDHPMINRTIVEGASAGSGKNIRVDGVSEILPHRDATKHELGK